MRNKLNSVLLLLFINAWLLAQQPTLTISPNFQVNPPDPLQISGQVGISAIDTLRYIEYRPVGGGNWSPVDNVDTLNLSFTHSLPTGSLGDGYHQYEFRVTVVDTAATKTAGDTLTIYVDKTPPQSSAPSVSSSYFSNTHSSIDISISFSEPLSPSGMSVFLKTSADTITLSNPSFSNNNTEVSYTVTKGMLPTPYANWEMPIDLWIEQAADTLGNLLQNRVFSSILVGDFTNPFVNSFSLSNDTLTTVSNSANFSVTFNELLKPGSGQAVFKTAQQQLSLNMAFSNNNRTASMNITAAMLGSGHNWYGTSNFTISGLADLADNPASPVNQAGPFIDILRPYPVQSNYSDNKINMQQTPIQFWLKFNEPIREVNPNLYLSNNTQTVNLNYTLSENSTRLDATIDTMLLSPIDNWQGAYYLRINGFTDKLGNPVKPDSILYRIDIDTHSPAAPPLIGYYPLLTVDSVVTVKGFKEPKAKFYYNEALLSQFANSSQWEVNVNTIRDSLYYLRFWQFDSLGNPGDTTLLKIMVDRELPTLASIPPTLNLKFDSVYDSLYFTLDIYFTESVSITNKNGFSLLAPEDSIELAQYPFEDHGSYHIVTIRDSSTINKLQKWYFESDSVWLVIQPGSFEDMAANTNDTTLTRRVLLNSITLIEDASISPKFTNARPDSLSDSALVDISFAADTPSEIVLKGNIQGSSGELVSTFNLFLNFNQAPFHIKNKKWGRLSSTGNRSVRWVFPIDSLAEDLYKIQLFSQTYYMGLSGNPMFLEFIVDRTTPEIESILPVAANNQHKVGNQPEFRIALKEEAPNQAPIKDVILQVPSSYENGFPKVNLDLHLTREDETGDYVINCKTNNVVITSGVQTLVLTISDSAGNKLVKNLEYEFVDKTGAGLSDLYNFPNPFNPKAGEQTTISFAFNGNGPVKIYIFDISSRLVYFSEQNYSQVTGSDLRKYVFWDGKDLNGNPVANGVYFCRIISGSQKSEILKIAVNNH